MTLSSSKTELQPICPKTPQPRVTDKLDSKNIKGILKQMIAIINPDWRKIFLFFSLLVIAVGGLIQSWGFSEQDISEHPPPPFYELIKPFPFWLVWVTTLFPLFIPYYILTIVFGYNIVFFFSGYNNYWIFIMSISIYYYLISCLVISFFDYKMKVDRGQTQPNFLYIWLSSRIVFHQNEKCFDQKIVIIGILITIIAIIGSPFNPLFSMVSYYSSLYLLVALCWTLWQYAAKKSHIGNKMPLNFSD